MKVICKANSGTALSERALASGNTRESRFNPLKIGQTYLVYGIHMYNNWLSYLVIPDEAMPPNWYPAELFEVVEPQLPFEWYFRFYGYIESGVCAVWGYKELVLDANHHDGLLELDGKALKTFLKRKKEMEEMY